LVLDADPERVYERKPELSICELGRQRSEYRELASRLGEAFVIDANLPPHEVARHALVIIAEYLKRRNLNNYPEWFAAAIPVSQ
jgi:thymidylate kinase